MKSYNPKTVKKPALTIVFMLLATVVFLTGCNSPEQKIENAQSEVVEANRELQESTREYQTDRNQYREEAAERIAANDSTITAFKTQIANKTADAKEAFQKQLAVLEQKNSDMKKKLADYKGEGKEQWDIFKAAFNRELNTLDDALKKLTDTNS